MDEQPSDLEVKMQAVATLISLLPPTATMVELEEIGNRMVSDVAEAWSRHKRRQVRPESEGGE